jgi:replicative DNA helicase
VPSASAEVLLISALINTTSVGSETQYGISAFDFEGYQDEYNWLSNYVETYGSQPTRDIFRVKFPGFIFSEHTDIRSAADMVHTSANRRRITTAMSEATDQLHIGDAEAAYDTLANAKPKRALARPRPLLTDLGHLDQWGDRRFAVELPYPTLQRFTGGIRAGNLWYLAGRPSQGKSAHLASIIKRAVLDGNRALFFSLEMSEEEVRARFHASLATDMGYPSLTLSELRDRHVDMAVYRKFIGELGERLAACGGSLDVHTPADGPVSPSVVAARCPEYDLTTIDYVGLMSQDGGGYAIDDWRVMAKISNALKSIALSQADTRLLCAAQINRDGETGSAPPKVKNLAQSDALGQDGDVVLTMRSKPKNVATHFSLEKNRHGTSDVSFYTTFDPNRGIYTEVSAEHVEDLVINAEELAINPSPPKLRVIKSKDEL